LLTCAGCGDPVPVGGGGMLSGVAVAAKARHPGIRIIAAEPAGADDCARSFAAGHIVPVGATQTIADGLLTTVGEVPWPILRAHVERVITVPDDAIVAAMRLVFERMKLVIEPSAAVGVAVALSDTFRALSGIRTVGIVLCGGNVDLDALPWSMRA
jgi:threonine dehydratase